MKMNILSTLEDSLAKAKETWVEKPAPERVHQEMSRAWVEALADALRNSYPSEDSVHVFSKGFEGNAADFGVNELLYDILVCRTGTVLSAKQGKELLYFTECIWQIESELARDSKQAILDFNKLVVGSAKKKLFIGPKVNDAEAYIEVLLPAAKVCDGDVYVALIPHPDEWLEEQQSVRLWKLDSRWVEISEN